MTDCDQEPPAKKVRCAGGVLLQKAHLKNIKESASLLDERVRINEQVPEDLETLDGGSRSLVILSTTPNNELFEQPSQEGQVCW